MTNHQVYLFGTCLIDAFYPKAGLDAVALLELAGCDIIFPQQQACCGQPPYNSGYKAEAIAAAEKTINLFSEQELPLVVPSASCAGMIKHHYPSLFETGSDLHCKAITLSSRTFELIEFIQDKLPYERLEKKRTPQDVALHTSCSSLREMNVASTWKQMLEKLPNIVPHLPEYAEECCGFGGTFAVKSEAISAVMTEDKVRNLIACPGKTIVSGDCGCLMNIEGKLKRVSATNSNNGKDCQTLASLILEQFDASC